MPGYATCCLPELLGKLVTLTAGHLCQPFKQRNDLPTHTLTGRIHHLLLEMGISCQVMVLGSNTLSSSQMHQDRVYATSLPRVAISHPDPPPIPCHATPCFAPCGAQTPKNLLTPEQTLPWNDGSDLARFLLGKITPHLEVGTCWSGSAKYLFAALQRWILKKFCKSLFSVLLCRDQYWCSSSHNKHLRWSLDFSFFENIRKLKVWGEILSVFILFQKGKVPVGKPKDTREKAGC